MFPPFLAGPAANGRMPRPGHAPPALVHRVVPGDTLWDIAEHYLGDPFQYPALAHLSQIRNLGLIYPRDIIRIIKRAP